LDVQFQPEHFVYDPEQGLLWFFATEGMVSVEWASRWQPWRRWHTSPCSERDDEHLSTASKADSKDRGTQIPGASV
jgi:hypothetical protein